MSNHEELPELEPLEPNPPRDMEVVGATVDALLPIVDAAAAPPLDELPGIGIKELPCPPPQVLPPTNSQSSIPGGHLFRVFFSLHPATDSNEILANIVRVILLLLFIKLILNYGTRQAA
jgi:hypothetical protein